MADNSQIQVVLVAVLVDPGDEPEDRTLQFVKSAVKSATRNIRGTASTGTILYTQEGEFDGSDMSGKVSQALQDAVNQFIGNLKQPEEPLI